MRDRIRGHEVGTALVLSACSIALIVLGVLGYLPRLGVPSGADSLAAVIPHLNAVISLGALVTIATGWRLARRRRIRYHRLAMLVSVTLFALFLIAYLYKVSVEGPTPFSGPTPIRQFVYLPILTIHISLALITIPLVYYVLLIAYTHSIGSIPQTPHPRVGQVAASLWLISFSLGLVVYLLLYHLY